MSVYLSTCLSASLACCLSVLLFFCLFGCLALYLSGWLSGCLSVCILSVWLYDCLAICLYLCVRTCLHACLHATCMYCASAAFHGMCACIHASMTCVLLACFMYVVLAMPHPPWPNTALAFAMYSPSVLGIGNAVVSAPYIGNVLGTHMCSVAC